MSARSARDTYLNQRDTSCQDVVAARERLKLHEARVQHYTATVNAVEDFIGEARSRFCAHGIPIYPISIPPHVNPVTLGDPASQLHDADEPSTAPPEHIQQSAGRMPTVANATSEKVRVFLNYICIFSLKVLTCRIRNDHFLAFHMFVKCNVYCVLVNINTLVERFFPRTHHSTSPILSANFCEPTLVLLSPLSFYYPHSCFIIPILHNASRICPPSF
jgi:hypothetical protein